MNIKVQPEFKREFTQIAEKLGMPAATAMKVLAQRFVAEGGFPFDVRIPQYGQKKGRGQIIKACKKDGKTIVPASWRDEDEDDSDYADYEELL